MIKGAIFDMDGTLLDSMMIWDSIVEEYIESIGFTPDPDLRVKVNNMSLLQAAEFIKEEFSLTSSVSDMIADVNKIAERHYINDVAIKAGLMNLLDYLEKNNVKMCIATATDQYLVKKILDKCGISKYFSNIFTCTDVGYGKNNPYIYRKALESLNVPKEKTVVFEDAWYAVKTAKKDGFFVAAVYDEYEKYHKEVEETADFVISDYNDLKDFFKVIENM